VQPVTVKTYALGWPRAACMSPPNGACHEASYQPQVTVKPRNSALVIRWCQSAIDSNVWTWTWCAKSEVLNIQNFGESETACTYMHASELAAVPVARFH